MSVKTQFGIGSQVEPKVNASIEAVTNQIPCPILGKILISSELPPRAKAGSVNLLQKICRITKPSTS
jgi:hypothetical protein